MKAVLVKEWCTPEALSIEEVERPTPRPGEVLIRVSAAALNFFDVLMVAGKYQLKPSLPFSPGAEVAGIIEDSNIEDSNGKLLLFKPGQRVFAQVALGGFAEYVCAPAANVHSLPESMTYEEGASFGITYQTSYFGLAYRAQLRAGETVLVHSAAGGVGTAALQIARALGAGKIIGTAGSDDKLPVILDNGADVALNYQKEDFVEVVKRETNGRGVDIIYDPVGGDLGERNTKCIAFEGRIILIGFTSGKFSNFAANHILIKNYSVVGLHWGAYRQQLPERITEAWRELFELYAQKKIKPVIGGVYSMEKVAEAMEFLVSRNATGKLVLRW
ncbi:MAG TPA: NADPH:quinone oxidoreductase family protein [Blastocatellia bacterium]|nr:NADPH:quinone oxidoreductase family protein [Blastocatellia bacterium]